MLCTINHPYIGLLRVAFAGILAVACGQNSNEIGGGSPSGSLAVPGPGVPGGGPLGGVTGDSSPTSGSPAEQGAVAVGQQSASMGTGGAAGFGEEGLGAGGLGSSGFDGPPGAREGLAGRLSKHEYKNSVFDALGVSLTDEELDPNAGGLPVDNGDGVFKHYSDKQTSTEQHTLAYFEVADAVAQRVEVARLANELDVCQLASADCGDAWIARLGERLFRHPLDERELSLYGGVFAEALTDGAEFDEAARWVVLALLQAPAFLFHIEDETIGTPGADRALSGYEMAARLASFLWVSVPDDELRDAAAAGVLDTNEGAEAQVSRMLADPKAQRFTEAFITDFSRAHQATYDGVTEDMRQALHDSVVATFQYHFWDAQRSVAELFTTREFVVNPEVAELLGASPAGGGTGTAQVGAGDTTRVLDISQLPQRVGIMSHPGVIAGMGDREIGSFVNRGKYLLERLLCQNPIAFPAGLEDALEEFNETTSGLNEHEKVALRMQRPECWACHAQFEPFAFGFSRFDAAGRYVGEVDADGKPLSLDGWVPIAAQADAPQYADFAEYMQILSTEERVQLCMTEHFLDFATARSPDPVARAHAELVGTDYLAAGATLPAMVAAVVSSPLFDSIKVSPSPEGVQ